jgi:methionine synthase I (cobalamin-dependent)
VDQLRKKIVATKEGGMITGEERLRENLTNLYGAVNGYEGRPSQMQINRTAAIAREMADVKRDFDAWISTRLGPINAMLSARNAPRIEVPVP